MGVCTSKKRNSEEVIIRKAFNKADKDKSGFIEKSELAQLLTSIAKDMKKPQPEQNEIDEAMKKIDTNKDEKISFPEYKNFIKAALKEYNAVQ